MKNDPLKAPMTLEEQEFAIQNHYLVGKYLKIRKLPFDEWYDVVIFRYMRSVKRWFAFPELHKHKFEIIAFYAMRSAIGGELAKQGRRIQTVSLDENIPGTDGMTYADTVTYDNLNYIQYGESEGDNMQIKYNVKDIPQKNSFRGAQKSDEILALESFIAGNMKNMCFEYDTEEEAKRKSQSVGSYKRSHKHQNIYDSYRVGKCVYVVRLECKKKGVQV